MSQIKNVSGELGYWNLWENLVNVVARNVPTYWQADTDPGPSKCSMRFWRQDATVATHELFCGDHAINKFVHSILNNEFVISNGYFHLESSQASNLLFTNAVNRAGECVIDFVVVALLPIAASSSHKIRS